MSFQHQVRFVCDSCFAADITPLNAGAPIHARMAPPQGWATLVIGLDPSAAPTHLCPKCNARFQIFMENNSVERSGSDGSTDQSGSDDV